MWLIDIAGYIVGGLFTSLLIGFIDGKKHEEKDNTFICTVTAAIWPILLLWIFHLASLEAGVAINNKLNKPKNKEPEDSKDELTKQFEEMEKCFIVSHEGSEEKRVCNTQHLKNKLPKGYTILNCKLYKKPNGESGWITNVRGPSYYNWTFQKTPELSMAIAIDDAWKFYTKLERKYG